MIDALKGYNSDNPLRPLNLRVGIHTGPVVGGVVGTKRFLYDIWGDAGKCKQIYLLHAACEHNCSHCSCPSVLFGIVNLASRMESTGVPGRIQVSKEVVALIAKDEFHFESRGEIEVKGKGRIETFFLTSQITTN